MKIGILGSACDPPHRQHIAIGEYIRVKMGLDRIILVPSSISSIKGEAEVPPEHRLQMARLAIQDLPYWDISDRELKKGGISSTRDTIRVFRKQFPHDALFWIIGFDNLADMGSWQGGYDLLDMCTFIVVPRPSYSWGVVPSFVRDKVIFEDGCPAPKVSSTIIRTAIKKNINPMQYISQDIYGYIKKHKLYI